MFRARLLSPSHNFGGRRGGSNLEAAFSSSSHLTHHMVVVGYLTETRCCLSGWHDLERQGHSNLLELCPTDYNGGHLTPTVLMIFKMKHLMQTVKGHFENKTNNWSFGASVSNNGAIIVRLAPDRPTLKIGLNQVHRRQFKAGSSDVLNVQLVS